MRALGMIVKETQNKQHHKHRDIIIKEKIYILMIYCKEQVTYGSLWLTINFGFTERSYGFKLRSHRGTMRKYTKYVPQLLLDSQTLRHDIFLKKYLLEFFYYFMRERLFLMLSFKILREKLARSPPKLIPHACATTDHCVSSRYFRRIGFQLKKASLNFSAGLVFFIP